MILAAYMVPHPPMIVPAVGRGSEEQIEKTIRAYQEVAEEIAELKPDTIIISSPHATMYSDYFHISAGKGAKGSFANFRAPQVRFDETYDQDLVARIEDLADQAGFPAGTLGERDKKLDHGTMVPLYFIREKYKEGKIIRLGLSGLSLVEHYEMGQLIQEAIRQTGRKVVYIASGDLSHKLQSYGPYGFAPEGPRYDQRIMDVCSRASFGELFDFEETFCEKAAECGHRSFVIMAGVLDGIEVSARQLSHEDVTGVGYGICTFHPADSGEEESSVKADRKFLDQYFARKEEEMDQKLAGEDEYVRLARNSIESFIRRGKKIQIPTGIPQEMKTRQAGAFVSIHEYGRLRGCIGTILPTTDCLAQEIINNAVSAAVRDPRFDPIKEDELPWLEINVDVLSQPEVIDSMDQLDVKRYGVIVSCGRRRGLLLPDLDGVDTVEQQVAIARQKGGIRDDQEVTLERFEVVRHI